MLRVVLDTNVYVSALIRPQGPPGQIVKRFLENAFEIVLSPAIVEETARAFAYPKVRKYIRAAVDPQLWFEDVMLLAQLVAGEGELQDVSADPDDDKYFAAAMEGSATLIVTGDPGSSDLAADTGAECPAASRHCCACAWVTAGGRHWRSPSSVRGEPLQRREFDRADGAEASI